MKFQATLKLEGKSATGIEVPAEVVENLGSGKKPPVRVTIQGYTYRSTIATMNGVFMLPVSAEHRQGAGIQAGDEIEITLELDTEPRSVDLPEDLAAALAAKPGARDAFDTSAPSARKEFVRQVESAKAAETRAATGPHRPATAESRQSDARPALARPTHRYRVGQRLAMAQGSRDIARLAATCEVVALVPSENGELLYRVRSEREGFERVVDERDLSTLQPGLE